MFMIYSLIIVLSVAAFLGFSVSITQLVRLSISSNINSTIDVVPEHPNLQRRILFRSWHMSMPTVHASRSANHVEANGTDADVTRTNREETSLRSVRSIHRSWLWDSFNLTWVDIRCRWSASMELQSFHGSVFVLSARHPSSSAVQSSREVSTCCSMLSSIAEFDLRQRLDSTHIGHTHGIVVTCEKWNATLLEAQSIYSAFSFDQQFVAWQWRLGSQRKECKPTRHVACLSISLFYNHDVEEFRGREERRRVTSMLEMNCTFSAK